MFAVVGLIVTVVEPGVLGSDGDVGLGLLVVAVFATPPHAQVTSARRSGRVGTAERVVEQLAVRIALGTPVKGFRAATILEGDRTLRLLDNGVDDGHWPQPTEFQAGNS
jgi:hypothetical protein